MRDCAAPPLLSRIHPLQCKFINELTRKRAPPGEKAEGPTDRDLCLFYFPTPPYIPSFSGRFSPRPAGARGCATGSWGSSTHPIPSHFSARISRARHLFCFDGNFHFKSNPIPRLITRYWTSVSLGAFQFLMGSDALFKI